jgi:Domain of unknown function (DUF4268)
VTPVNAARQDFYADVLTTVNTVRPAIRVPARGRDNFITFASGPFGYWSMSMAEAQLRVEAYIDMEDQNLNKELFDEFAAARQGWEDKVGISPLSWERLDNRRASRIAAYQPVDLDDEEQRTQSAAWAKDTLIAMHDALNAPLRTAAKRIKATAAAHNDAVKAADYDSGSQPLEDLPGYRRPVLSADHHPASRRRAKPGLAFDGPTTWPNRTCPKLTARRRCAARCLAVQAPAVRPGSRNVELPQHAATPRRPRPSTDTASPD